MLVVGDVQGTWVASRGETIVIDGRSVTMNGVRTAGFKLEGEEIVGFSIYVLAEVQRGSGGVEEMLWRSSFMPEDDTQRWTRVDLAEIERRDAEMKATITE